jgi:protocatechuate 3,4-dioxygenase beta subunit
VELTAVVTAASVAASQASALSAELLANTIQAATAGTTSASVAVLMQEGVAGLISRKTKAALALLLAATVLGGAGLWFAQSRPEQEASAVKTDGLPPRRAPEARVLRGRVLGPDDKPVAGAKLYLPRPGELTLAERTATDKEGRFQIEWPRSETRSDPKVPLVAAAAGFGLAWVDLSEKEAPGELTLRLVKDVVIRGRLVSTEGKPVAGVTVNVAGLMAFERLDDFLRVFQRESRHIDEGTGARSLKVPLGNVLDIKLTDKDGRFEIRGVGVERVVGVEAKNAAIAPAMMLVVTREGFDAKAYLKSEIRAKGEPTRQLFGTSFEYIVERPVATKKKEIEGVVREAGSGKPVAGVVVEAAGAATVTDAKGHYRLAGVQILRELGEYLLRVNAPSDRPLIGRSVRVTPPADGKPMHVDVELPRGVVVTGRLYDKATGKGVPGWVTFAPLPENKTPKGEGLLLGAQAGADGRFRLATVPGPGVLLAQAHVNFKIDGVPISPYKRAEFDAADQPRIKIVSQPGLGRSFASADGLTLLDIFNACKVLDVSDDGKAVSCDLAFDPGKTQTVNLVDPDGKTLSGAVVAGVGADTLRAVPFKTSTGRIYALDPDNPRTVVFLHVERKLAAVVPMRGDEKEPLTVRLTPAGVITGRVLDGDGQPLAGAEVYTLYQTVGREFTKSQSRWSMPRTDKDGRFRVEAIVPGIKVDFGFIKGRQMLVPEKPLEIKPLQSGQTLDVGDVRVKPRRS